MKIALGLFAWVLLGTEGAPKPDTPLIRYDLRIVEMKGLGWRESLYSRLQPVTRQGGAMVWTADRETVEALVARSSPVVRAPRVSSPEKAAARITQSSTRKLATRLTRHADGPVDRAVPVAYSPDYEEVGEGFQMTISGREIDQGVLAWVLLEETRVAAVHQVMLTEFVTPKDAKAGEQQLNPKIDVPEVVKAGIEGEWLIPRDGAILVSLGAHTTADAEGKAVIHERLMLLEAQPVAAHEGPTRPFAFSLPRRDEVAAPLPMPVPATPSRSLPQGINKDGTPVPLPPLPDDHVPPATLPGTSDPCATPQVPTRRDPKATDPGSTKASHDKACDVPEGGTDDRNLPAVKSLTLRIPIASSVLIEIRAVVGSDQPR
jgi:hypothetical protein